MNARASGPLQVYGLHRGSELNVVAARSRAEALEAWDADPSVFETGAARVIRDQHNHRESLMRPGYVRRIPIGFDAFEQYEFFPPTARERHDRAAALQRLMDERIAGPPVDGGHAYEHRYVAFIDLLGFRQLIDDADRDDNLREAVVHNLRNMRRSVHPDGRIFRVTQFSDSIIMSTDYSDFGLGLMICALEAMATTILQVALLFRGGLVRDNILHDGAIVLGRGVNRAAGFDQRGAPPRITLSDEVVHDMAIDPTFGAKRWLRHDEADGKPYFHILRGFGSDISPWPNDEALAFAEEFVASYEANKDEFLRDPGVRAKWAWFTEYWNRTVRPAARLPLLQWKSEDPPAAPA